MESQPISKKSHLTVQGAQSFWIANLLWQQCPTSYTHVAMSTGRLTFKCPDTYLRPYTPLWDVGVSQICCPTLCATRRDLNLFLVVPCSPLLWLHNSVQASLNPSLTVNTLNFLLPTALSKHLFSIKPVTNIKVYCEQINLNTNHGQWSLMKKDKGDEVKEIRWRVWLIVVLMFPRCIGFPLPTIPVDLTSSSMMVALLV